MTESTERDEHILHANGRDIPYCIVTSGRATRMRIDVDVEGIRVTVPENHTRDPHAFVRKKADWIREKYEKFERYRERIPDRTFEEGASFPFLGKGRTLKRADRAYSILTDDHFILAEERVRSSSIREELEHLYRREARKVYESLVEEYAERMEVAYGRIEVRNQKTRWGSCSPKDTLSFNWRLMMAPEEIVTYVVIHELAHLRERNHTDAFWRVVAEYDPEYREHGRWLKENAAKLTFRTD